MTAATVERLAELAGSAAAGEATAAPLRLRRAWPRGPDRLLLEFVASDGALVPGQWFADERRARRVAEATRHAATAPASCRFLPLRAGALVLQSGGADRRLPGIAALLAQPGAALVSHRPERRAVVRLSAAGAVRFAKAVRPERLKPLERPAPRDPRGAFRTPAIVACEPAAGVVVVDAVPGTDLGRRLRAGPAEAELRRAGRALAALHTLVATAEGADRPPHDAAAETDVVTRWLADAAAHGADPAGRMRGRAEDVRHALASSTSPPALLHRDLHDKQVFVTDDGDVAFIDLDTLAVGEAALDVANMLAHLELRGLMLGRPEAFAAAAAAAWLDGYAPSPAVEARIPAYLDAARLRLACVYAFRPGRDAEASALLDRVGRTWPGGPCAAE